MPREIQVNETSGTRRRVYFHLVDVLDGITAETAEADGQPQISIDGATWVSAGIGVLVAIGNGRYYAELAVTAVVSVGSVIETRYKSAATAECPGDSVIVVLGSATLTIDVGEGSPQTPLVIATQRRGFTKDIIILDVNADAIVPLPGDKIRAYIGREGEINSDLSGAVFLVTSDSATANGSSFTKNSPLSGTNRLRVDADDLTFAPGIYTLFVDFYDGNDSNEWKSCSRDVFCLEQS